MSNTTTARPIITPPPWSKGKPRSMGGAFDELYRQRAPADRLTPPSKTGPRPSQATKAKVLAALRDEPQSGR